MCERLCLYYKLLNKTINYPNNLECFLLGMYFYKLYIIYYYPAHWFRPILPLHCLYIIVTQHLQLSYSRDYGTKFRNTLHSRGCI